MATDSTTRRFNEAIMPYPKHPPEARPIFRQLCEEMQAAYVNAIHDPHFSIRLALDVFAALPAANILSNSSEDGRDLEEYFLATLNKCLAHQRKKRTQ
jgi:hypothetical protein